jgi:hypothetical protein
MTPPPGLPFALGVAALAAGAAALAGALPVGVSVAAVFLFAGPHNWFEARYVLGRLPARTGKLRAFFVVSAVGILALTATFPLLPLAGDATPYALWNTAFLFWVATLVWMRSRTNPRFDGGWVWPLACLLSAGVWLEPVALNVALIYLHPLLALWLLDRELTRSRRAWRFAYRWAVLLVPVLLGVLWWRLRDAPDLPGADPLSLTAKIVNHSGSGFLGGVSTHFLVAAHAFLELVHYGVWVVLIPLVGLRSWPWELGTIPAARRSRGWARGVAALLVAGLALVLLLWVCFALDYSTTRGVYFTVAVLHVLAEVPFLLRMV